MSDVIDADHLHHHYKPMRGRDPGEPHRVATPLELLFDLTFVIAFGLAASQLAHAIAEGHVGNGLLGFGFASFAICLAWSNFTWFASAYDTDDWVFRLATMAQMSGVLVFALGLPRMFASLEVDDGRIDIGIMVLGYVIMRMAMVFQWLRAARQDPSRRATCLLYAIGISVAQAGWFAMIFASFPPVATFAAIVALAGLELLLPWLAEHLHDGTPWHAHHVAERYSLFAIIAMGEGIVGTVASLSAVVDVHGWTLDTALVCVAGVGLTFAMWWTYYILPSGYVLHHHRRRGFTWAHTQLLIIASIVATGAGLHVAAYYLQHEAHIGAVATLLATAIPVAVFLLAIYGLYYYLVRRFDPFHLWLLIATVAVMVAAVGAAMSGVDMTACLCVLMLAPVVTVIGYEWRGHRHEAASLLH
ncbi:putative membrane protein [Lysobacter dokdonensis DS-58]|uniref:Putative membrane protein n=1 Tax=Lysobacter dokdonensis DS-58 TaxID=1300345 RepID=A0A0A2WEG2_9GAMM|nr:low temperature requirement protein A [Lysobacter dokdonensis]KGQ18596.1 putative membrane protein [Lysobacter dokdonensis DS-58]